MFRWPLLQLVLNSASDAVYDVWATLKQNEDGTVQLDEADTTQQVVRHRAKPCAEPSPACVTHLAYRLRNTSSEDARG